MASRIPSPFGAGRGMLGGDPLTDLHREMNRLFDDVFRGAGLAPLAGGSVQASLAATPRIDVHEEDDALVLAAELPGVTRADIDLRLEGDLLVLSGEKRDRLAQRRAGGGMHLSERSFGRFQRTLQLPFEPDPEQVGASFEDGVLTVRLPRPRQQRERSRRIEVRGGETIEASAGAPTGAAQASGGPGVASRPPEPAADAPRHAQAWQPGLEAQDGQGAAGEAGVAHAGHVAPTRASEAAGDAADAPDDPPPSSTEARLRGAT